MHGYKAQDGKMPANYEKVGRFMADLKVLVATLRETCNDTIAVSWCRRPLGRKRRLTLFDSQNDIKLLEKMDPMYSELLVSN
jgi:hypothetical protein